MLPETISAGDIDANGLREEEKLIDKRNLPKNAKPRDQCDYGHPEDHNQQDSGHRDYPCSMIAVGDWKERPTMTPASPKRDQMLETGVDQDGR
ncbi:hypothetical protein EYZ11_008598 [Aspergillus tanneri]|uniref:Uncharacterized protein n=1 Tax=Aspergillus tanneri TaxID=1220188 RepID=A0A4S3JA26_9EURO|nr:hypothetical protein EYZ11_008598 [Aspergillus tanneri]